MLDVLQAIGYGGSRADAANRLGQSGDGGVDGVIREDRLGLDQIYVQAKKWADPVGRPEIQRFFGALHGQRATKGVFITTSTFTRGARDYANDVTPRVILVDGIERSEPRNPRKAGRMALFPAPPAKRGAQRGRSGVDAALLSR